MTTPEPGDVIAVDRAELTALCHATLEAAGADRRVAGLLVEAALFAEDRGKSAVGVAHLLDYIGAMTDGRLDGRAVPAIAHRVPAVITSDARGGIAHTGFDGSFADLVQAARHCGLAAFAQQNAFTCGQLGWFTERLADAGLVAVATAVSPAVLAAGPGTGRVFGTNPMAYSVPRAGGQPLTVDQASSSTAFVSVREAAARGEGLPEGWAIDRDGLPTTDAEAALAGALLPFGGYKGANIALLAELLSSMAGGNWSLDAPSSDSGSRSPSGRRPGLASGRWPRSTPPTCPSRCAAPPTRGAGRRRAPRSPPTGRRAGGRPRGRRGRAGVARPPRGCRWPSWSS